MEVVGGRSEGHTGKNPPLAATQLGAIGPDGHLTALRCDAEGNLLSVPTGAASGGGGGSEPLPTGLTDTELRAAPVETVEPALQSFKEGVSAGTNTRAVALVDQFGVPLSNPTATRPHIDVHLRDGDGNAIGSLTSRLRVIISENVDLTAQSVEDNIATVGRYGIPALFARATVPANRSDADGDYELPQMSGGKIWVKQNDSPTLFKNLGANATLNVKAAAGKVFSVACYNANAAARFLQLHDTATVPAGAAVPVFSFLIAPAGQIIIGIDFFTAEGANFATGIAFAFSTTRDTYTAGTAAEQSTFIQYK